MRLENEFRIKLKKEEIVSVKMMEMKLSGDRKVAEKANIIFF